MKAYVEAYGCTLNFGETREIEDLLVLKGWDLVKAPEEADLAVLATCVVIEKTEKAMLKRLRELAKAPRLIVTGCMATACRDRAEALVPDAEFVAPGDIGTFSDIIEANSSQNVVGSVERESYGIVPIASGCLGSCAYCITRLARGHLRSRPVEAICESVERLARTGPREIQLTAQDTAAYGADIDVDLPSLVERTCRIPRDFRLRVGMMNPRNALPLLDGLVRMYAEPKVFKFLHLPVQSGSDRLLDGMERGYTVADFGAIVRRLREASKRLTFSTDLIIGYPGETEEDHAENLRVISELKPDIVNVTRYSPRPGTKAALAESPVVGWKAKERSREITALRFEVALEKNRGWLGTRTRVLATEPGKRDSTLMRTDEYKQVVVPGMHRLSRFYDVRIVGATPTYLRGSLEGPV